MDETLIRNILEAVRNGSCNTEDALETLRKLPYEDIGFARLDHHRKMRSGFPEVIFCQGKTEEQVKLIFERLLENNQNIMGTRASVSQFEHVSKAIPDAVFHQTARIISVERKPLPVRNGYIAVLSAGTADMPVAEEAAITAQLMGNKVERLYDVGVAGIHRLISNMNIFVNANVLIVVAGMEGALASVVGGLVKRPVIAVPTSIGYGASFGGLSALLTMLNSCAAGIGVVNIDNGFGAAYLATSINRLANEREE